MPENPDPSQRPVPSAHPTQTPEASEHPARRRPRQGPGVRYIGRLITGIAVYVAGLVGAAAIVHTAGEGPGVLPGLLTLPGIAIVVWAVLAYYGEADEFERRKLGEAILIGFLVGVPVILAVGVLQYFGLPPINWMGAYVILMTAWLLGAVVTAIRYR